MSKINIKAILKSNEETHIFQGKGIKKDSRIIYLDENTQTKINLDNIITIERKSNYHLILNLKKGIKLKGKYINNYGTIELETYAAEIIKKKNEIQITYTIIANKEVLDTFTYKLKFSLDTWIEYDTMF